MPSFRTRVCPASKFYGSTHNSKKIFFAILVLIILMSFGKIEPVFSTPEKFLLTRKDKIFSLHFLDENNGFSVGSKGLLLHTPSGWNGLAIISHPFFSL